MADGAVRNRSAFAARLEVPTLTVGGAQSTSGPLPALAGDEVSSHHHNVTVEGAGHWIPEEAPRALVDAWRTWQQQLIDSRGRTTSPQH